ncbi:MAG: electron transport complex subunit RsxG [Gammaproteobacteria bacterium]|nr:MAG: electron transport complex subunit RsxG [Gammaproteobacteria bacterium]
MSEIRQAITKSVIGLAAFAALTAGLIATTQLLTTERIEQQKKLSQSRALREIFPNQYHDNEFLDDIVTLPESDQLGSHEPLQGFLSRKAGQVNGVLIPAVAPDGYSGKIRLITGIESNGKIAGVRVLEHRETPGLGDKIEPRKSDWIQHFVGKSLVNPSANNWKVVKDGGEFDQLTGATITPRAIVKAVYGTLIYFDRHNTYLLGVDTKDYSKRDNQSAAGEKISAGDKQSEP